jgi:hypothetical protein
VRGEGELALKKRGGSCGSGVARGAFPERCVGHVSEGVSLGGKEVVRPPAGAGFASRKWVLGAMFFCTCERLL